MYNIQNYGTLFSSRDTICRIASPELAPRLDASCADWLPGFFGPSPSTSLDERATEYIELAQILPNF